MATKKEIYEQIYKLSTDGHDKVLSNLDAIHKSVLGIAEDVTFKPEGFKNIVVEVKKAKSVVDDLSKSINSMPVAVADQLKKSFSGLGKGVVKDLAGVQKEFEKTGSYWENLGKGVNVEKSLSPAIESAVQKGTSDGFKAAFDRKMLFGAVEGIKIKFEAIKKEISEAGEDFEKSMKRTVTRTERTLSDIQELENLDLNLIDPHKVKTLVRGFEDSVEDIGDALKKSYEDAQTAAEKKAEEAAKKAEGRNIRIAEGLVGFIGDGLKSLQSPDALLSGIKSAGAFLKKASEEYKKEAKEQAEAIKKAKKREATGLPSIPGGKGKGGKVAAAAKGAGGGGGAETAEVAAAMGAMTAAMATAVAAVAAIGALVKILIDADSAIKEFNKSVLDNVSAGNMMRESILGTADVSAAFDKSMKTMYNAASDFSFFLETGVKAEEFNVAIGSMSKAGYTYQSVINEAGDDTRNLQDAVRLANVGARIFGMSLTESAETVGDWRKNLGLSMEEIKESFAIIQKDALESNMDVGKFFNTVKNVSSDFVLFGVRAHEVSGMLEMLGKAVGPKKAAEMIGGLVGQMKNMSDADRMRITALAGQKKSIEAVRGSQQRALAELHKHNKGLFEGAEGQKLYQQALNGNVGALEKLQKRASNTKGLEDVARRFSTIIDVQKEAQTGLAGRATAIASTDLQAQIEVQFASIKNLVGTPIEKTMGINANIARQQLGLSLEQWKAMKRLDAGMRQEMEKQYKLARKIKTKKQLDTLDKSVKYAKLGNQLYKRGADGQMRVAKKTDFMSSEMKDQVKAMEDQKTVAHKAAEATISMTDIMEQGFKDIMRALGQLTSGFAKVFSPFLTPLTKAQMAASDVLKKGLASKDPEIREEAKKLYKATQNALDALPSSATEKKVLDTVSKVKSDLNKKGVREREQLEKKTPKTALEAKKNSEAMAKSFKKSAAQEKLGGSLTDAVEKSQTGFVDVFLALEKSGLKTVANTGSMALSGGIFNWESFKENMGGIYDSWSDVAKKTYDLGDKYLGSSEDVVGKFDKTFESGKSEEAIEIFNNSLATGSDIVNKALSDEEDKRQKNNRLLHDANEEYKDNVRYIKQLNDMEKEKLKLALMSKISSGETLTESEKKFAKDLEVKIPKKVGTKPSGQQPAKDIMISKAGYVKLSAGDIAFNPSEAARGMRAPAGALAGKAISSLTSKGGSGSTTINRNQSNVFNIVGDPEKVKRVILQVLAEDKRRESEGIAQ